MFTTKIYIFLGEHKTKPTQASVRELRGLGLSPDIIFCRSEQAIAEEERWEQGCLLLNIGVRSVGERRWSLVLPLILDEMSKPSSFIYIFFSKSISLK